MLSKGIARRFGKLIKLSDYENTTAKASAKVTGDVLTPRDIACVARNYQQVQLGSSERASKGFALIQKMIADGNRTLYGVHTNYGGHATKGSSSLGTDAIDRQTNLLWALSADAGNALPRESVRAALFLRTNSLIQGASGVSWSLIERCETFLNKRLTPVVKEHGSIGASGDLVPLTMVCGSLIGLAPHFKIEGPDGTVLPAPVALAVNGMDKLKLAPKDAIGFVNGTSFSLGIGSLALYDAVRYYDLALSIESLICNVMMANMEAFSGYVAQIRPYNSHKYVSEIFRERLAGSKLTVRTLDEAVKSKYKTLVQDRYPIRCLPQYMAPLLDKLSSVQEYFENESVTVSDNPVLDIKSGEVYHGGNFLATGPTMGCDDIRYSMAIMVKSLDALIGQLHEPSMSLELPHSLRATEDGVAMGLKGPQILLNSIAGKVLYYASPVWPLFSTHSEQYNQAVNSLAFQSALMASESCRLTQTYLSVALMHAIQACELRTKQIFGSYCAKEYISPRLIPLYDAYYTVIGKQSSSSKPAFITDYDCAYSVAIEAISKDIASPESKIMAALHKSKATPRTFAHTTSPHDKKTETLVQPTDT